MHKQAGRGRALAAIAGRILRSRGAREIAERGTMAGVTYAAEPYLARAVAGGAENLPNRPRSSRIMTSLFAGALGPRGVGKTFKAPLIKRLGPITATTAIAAPTLASGVSHRMFGPGGMREGNETMRNLAAAAGTIAGNDPQATQRLTDVTRNATRGAISDVLAENKDEFKQFAGTFGKEMGTNIGRHAAFGAIPGLTAYALARRFLPRTELPENRSIAEADEFYEAERRRRLAATAIGLATTGLGVGASLAAPRMANGLQGLLRRFKQG